MTLAAVKPARQRPLNGFPLGAGLTSVSIPGVRFAQALRLPADEVSSFATRGGQVSFAFDAPVTNANVDLGQANDDDPLMVRRFSVPAAATFTMIGQATPSPGPALAALIPSVSSSVHITSSSVLGQLPRFNGSNLLTQSGQPWIAGQGDSHPSVTVSWSGNRTVDSIVLKPTAQAARPLRVEVSSSAGRAVEAVPMQGGVVRFPPMTTDSITIGFVKVTRQVGQVPVSRTRIALPVGVEQLSIPALGPIAASRPADRSLVLPCGSGPSIRLDGRVLRTTVIGTTTQLQDLDPLGLVVCGGPVAIGAGSHVLGAGRVDGAFKVTSLQAVPRTPAPNLPTRGARIVGSWGAARRQVRVGAGARSYLALAQNYNSGWKATLNGQPLTAVRLDGWEQAWILPAGSGGTVVMTYPADTWYRLALLLGGILVAARSPRWRWCGADVGSSRRRRRAPAYRVGPRGCSVLRRTRRALWAVLPGVHPVGLRGATLGPKALDGHRRRIVRRGGRRGSRLTGGLAGHRSRRLRLAGTGTDGGRPCRAAGEPAASRRRSQWTCRHGARVHGWRGLMALRTLKDAAPSAHAARPTTAGGIALWAGTVAYGGSTVALLAVLSRHSSRSGFTAVAAVLGLAFVVSLVPAGTTLRSASLVADGYPPPALRPGSALLVSAVSLAVSPGLAYLLHVPVLAAAIVTIQMVVAIPLAIRQGALLGRHRFGALGTNLVIEGVARLALGAIAGVLLGVTGLALGLCAGTVIALLILPEWRSEVVLRDRPRTSLSATSASLALLGLFVQLDVLLAPSVLTRNGATVYDLAAVPSKGVYLALLAIGPLIFPSVRGRPDRRLVLWATSAALGFGTLCTGALVAGRHLIALVLGRPSADPRQMALLGLSMALAGVTGIAISAGIARGVRHPWPPLVLGIAAMAAVWPFRPDPLTFSVVVLASQTLTTVLCTGNCLRRTRPVPADAESSMELFAEAGDPLVPAQAAGTFAVPDATAEQSVPTDSVAVIIPTFRRPQLLARLLDSLARGTVVPDEIIVVDNDPGGSVDAGALPSGVRLVRAGLGVNVTGARDAGWRASHSRICIFVDDDNEVDEGCIEALTWAAGNDDVGLAGPVIFSGDQGTVWCAGLEISRWTGIARCKSIGRQEPAGALPQWPTDAMPDAYAMRHDVLEILGGLDEGSFPMCGEEYDLAARVAELGLERVVVRDARVRHYGNVSENPGRYMVRSTMQHGQERARLMARARVRVHQRHARWPGPVHHPCDLRPPLGHCIGRLVPEGPRSNGDTGGNDQGDRLGHRRGLPERPRMRSSVEVLGGPDRSDRATRLKIVAVTWRDLVHPSAGGAEVLIDRLLTGLHERGHDVALVCGGPVSEHPYEVVDAGGTYSQYLRAPAICMRRFREADVLIDVQNGMPYFSPLWRQRPCVCLVHHVHTDQWAQRFPPPLARTLRAVERRGMPLVYRNRRYVAISRSTASALTEIGVRSESITVVESGVDTPEGPLPGTSAEPLFLSLNRLVPHKRINLLLRAWELVHPRVGGRLVIAGDGPLLDDLRQQASTIPRVEVRGHVDEEEKRILLARAWAVLSASHHEGWGMSVLEGAAVGTPTLAVDAPGIRDAVVDGVTGKLVWAPDESALPQALGQAIVDFVQDHELRRDLGAAARRRAAERSWDDSIDRWEAVLLRAAQDSGRALRGTSSLPALTHRSTAQPWISTNRGW